jgi:hypothetical protein
MFDTETFLDAVFDWFDDRESTEQTHGHISTWDVSNVTKKTKNKKKQDN